MKKARRYLEQQLKLPEKRLDVVKDQLTKLVDEVRIHLGFLLTDAVLTVIRFIGADAPVSCHPGSQSSSTSAKAQGDRYLRSAEEATRGWRKGSNAQGARP